MLRFVMPRESLSRGNYYPSTRHGGWDYTCLEIINVGASGDCYLGFSGYLWSLWVFLAGDGAEFL